MVPRPTIRRLVALALALGPLAAGGSGGGGGGGGPGSPKPGTGSLTGASAFDVAWAWMETASATSACGGTATGPAGGLVAVAVELFENDESSLACTDGGSFSGATGRDVDLEIATTEYIQGATTYTQTLAPGTYVLGDEGVDDPDLCMLPSGTNAFLAIVDFGGVTDAVETGVSGTVTIDTISATEIAGSFDVFLGGPDGQTDGGPQSLEGTFDAVTCP